MFSLQIEFKGKFEAFECEKNVLCSNFWEQGSIILILTGKFDLSCINRWFD